MTRKEIIKRCQSWTVDECVQALEQYDDGEAMFVVKAWYKGRDLDAVLPDLQRMCIARLTFSA